MIGVIGKIKINSILNGFEKGKKLPIGTVTNGRKKVAEGKWVLVKKDVNKVEDIVKPPNKITQYNFHEATKAKFKLISSNENAKKKFELILAGNELFFISKSGSEYFVADGGVYRLSDHWGSVATCTWEIEGGPGNLKLGFCKFSDFTSKKQYKEYSTFNVKHPTRGLIKVHIPSNEMDKVNKKDIVGEIEVYGEWVYSRYGYKV